MRQPPRESRAEGFWTLILLLLVVVVGSCGLETSIQFVEVEEKDETI